MYVPAYAVTQLPKHAVITAAAWATTFGGYTPSFATSVFRAPVSGFMIAEVCSRIVDIGTRLSQLEP